MKKSHVFSVGMLFKGLNKIASWYFDNCYTYEKKLNVMMCDIKGYPAWNYRKERRPLD